MMSPAVPMRSRTSSAAPRNVDLLSGIGKGLAISARHAVFYFPGGSLRTGQGDSERPRTCDNGFPDRSTKWQNPTGPEREGAGQRHIWRRAWDSNPQALSGNGFQDRPLAN